MHLQQGDYASAAEDFSLALEARPDDTDPYSLGTVLSNLAVAHMYLGDHADALDLLEQFHDDVDELGVTELSKRLKLHKNNVFRLLATLESRGYIEQNKATENYRLGLKALELGQTFIKQMGLLRQAKPILEKIVEDCVAANVPRVWMHDNTFMESSVSQTAVETCRENDIVVIDGGCPMMFLEFGHKCMRWMLGMMKRLPE